MFGVGAEICKILVNIALLLVNCASSTRVVAGRVAKSVVTDKILALAARAAIVALKLARANTISKAATLVLLFCAIAASKSPLQGK